MGISLELVDFNNLFNNATKIPTIINDIHESSSDDKEKLNGLIYTRYSSDLLSNLPTCECGDTVGEFNIGIECRNCHTEVKATIESDLDPLLWMRAPNGVAALMNPMIWTMLSNKFTRSGFNIIRWICDTTYKPQVKIPPIMEAVMELRIERGWNNFVHNFDYIIAALFNLKGFRTKKDILDPLEILLKEYRNCIFTQYLPLPNRSLLVIEETNVGTYIDPIITGAIDAIRTMAGIDSPLSNFSVRTKENRTVKTIAQLAEFYDDLSRNSLARKEGLFRKHIYGTRSHFSFRSVISSLTGRHRYDEIYIPWGIGIGVFRIHLLNKLLKAGHTPNTAIAFLNEHAQKYHPELDRLFNELIAESPTDGISVIMQRNPSLERGSAQHVFITKVKTNINDPTVSMSILTVRGLNADYDGDQLNFTLAIDNYIADGLAALAPHKSVSDLNAPRAVSKNLSMPKTVVGTISNFLHTDDGVIDSAKVKQMEKMFS